MTWAERFEKAAALAAEAWRRSRELASRLRTDFEAKSKFQRLRIVVMGLFVLDLLFTPVFVMAVGQSDPDLEAWYQKGFPHDILVVRNSSGDVLDEVELILDQKYRLRLEELGEGTNGFEMSERFAGPDGLGPAGDYRPQQLTIVVDGDPFPIKLQEQKRDF